MDDEKPIKPKPHEIGMPIDALSADELKARIAILEAEIVRLRNAIEARQETRRAAESIFRL